ncbi:hypothetical protein GQX74_014456 [Glossina fuscipes]|nr:hypothetical protein GQX74_014456 [Glossina fuscipes]
MNSSQDENRMSPIATADAYFADNPSNKCEQDLIALVVASANSAKVAGDAATSLVSVGGGSTVFCSATAGSACLPSSAITWVPA